MPVMELDNFCQGGVIGTFAVIANDGDFEARPMPLEIGLGQNQIHQARPPLHYREHSIQFNCFTYCFFLSRVG